MNIVFMKFNRTVFSFTHLLISLHVSWILSFLIYLVLLMFLVLVTIYYVTFIDDFNRRTWVYFLKSKYEVFSHFKDFKAMVETRTRKKIKCLKTDNGSEYYSIDFDRFYIHCRIKRQKTTLYSPQLNGVSKRMNRTLMERARIMLSGAGLEQEFWDEAISIACQDKTLMEMWSRKNPSLRHLRVFGCDAYAHMPKEKRQKLDSKAIKCIFICYSYPV